MMRSGKDFHRFNAQGFRSRSGALAPLAGLPRLRQRLLREGKYGSALIARGNRQEFGDVDAAFVALVFDNE